MAEPAPDHVVPAPVVPDYDGRCIAAVVPALFEPAGARPGWLPAPAQAARQVVLLVLDGVGWRQLRERPHMAPTLNGLAGGPAHSVAPTTTATALASIVSGRTPAEHGILGFSVIVDGKVLNVLRWTTPDGDARERIVPEAFQSTAAFRGATVPAVVKSEFAGSGFTRAHLAGADLRGWRYPSTIVVEVARALRDGERFVYAYYDGVDAVAHAHGLGEHYDAELRAADRLVAEVIEALPDGAALVVTSDHGQVHVGGAVLPVEREVAGRCSAQSGEPRFLWLHCRRGVRADRLAEAARDAHGDVAWVLTRDELVDAGWYGGVPARRFLDRLGDVALVPYEPVAFWDAETHGPLRLVSLHGSLTADEVEVPLLAAAP